MIGVDTNILIRAVLEDHPKEASIAKKLLIKLSRSKKLFISSYALLEMIWVLKVKGRSREVISEIILDLLDSPGVIISNHDAVTSALEHYIKGKADFGDYLIMADGDLHDSPKLASFDKALTKDSQKCHHPSEFI